MNNLEISQATTLPVRKTPAKKPFTLVAAAFFLILAILPFVFVFAPETEADSKDLPPVVAENTQSGNLTLNQKIEEIAATFEKVFYPEYKESSLNVSAEETLKKEANRKEFFVTGTWVMFVVLTVSSAFMAAVLILMYISPGLSYNVRSIVMVICATLAIVGALVMATMHIYSIVVLVKRIPTIETNVKLVDQKAKDACTTETIYYILKSALVTAGLGYYIYSLPAFAFSSELNKKPQKKLLKKAKKLQFGYTCAALVCTYYAIVIALTWTFNFFTIALLSIIGTMAILSYIMVGYTHDFHKCLKKIISKESVQTVTTSQN